MINPLEWLLQWCRADALLRRAFLDIDEPSGSARATLHFIDAKGEREVVGLGATFDDAIVSCIMQLTGGEVQA